LTKKGREILSSGGNFEVTKFALGDDEIDYSLWDTAHSRGTDYYGAVLDNLPALEPFNDPSEIMKYKLVTRNSASVRAMIQLIDGGGTTTGLVNLVYFKNSNSGAMRTQISAPAIVNTELGGGATGTETTFSSKEINIGRKPNGEFVGLTEFGLLELETYTVTLLDSSIAILAPQYETTGGQDTIVPESTTVDGDGNFEPSAADQLWIPFVDNVQHISQTISNCTLDGGSLLFPQAAGTTTDPKNLRVYPKTVTYDPTKTSLIIMGELSGAVLEFDITIEYDTTT